MLRCRLGTRSWIRLIVQNAKLTPFAALDPGRLTEVAVVAPDLAAAAVVAAMIYQVSQRWGGC